MKPSRPQLRGPIGLCAALAWVMLSPVAAAQDYSVKLNSTLNGLDVKIDPVAAEGMLVVNVSNASDKKVRCDFVYEAPPQVPYRTSAFAEPGKSTTSVFRASRKWFNVTVNVNCLAV